MASEEAIESHAQLLRDNAPPWFGKRDKWGNIAESARDEWRKMASAALDAAAAVDVDAQWNAALKEAIEACDNERVQPDDDNEVDATYNAAIGHCIAAIRSLKKGPTT